MRRLEINVGGVTKKELARQLAQADIQLNEYAKQLLQHESLVVEQAVSQVEVVLLTVAELDLSEGGTLPTVFNQAIKLGYQLCPLEVALFFRLQYLNQISSSGLKTEHKAPRESLTVASPIVEEDDNFPKGFYLRKIDGINWLRGYCCDDQHVFVPSDYFVFLNRE